MTIAPFDPVIREGRMYGRGSVDDKAGLAAMMHAVASIKEDGLVPDCEVWLAAVVDEEFSYRGVVRLCDKLIAAAIVAEPTELRPWSQARVFGFGSYVRQICAQFETAS
jgi:acetylornithine deacetylase